MWLESAWNAWKTRFQQSFFFKIFWGRAPTPPPVGSADFNPVLSGKNSRADPPIGFTPYAYVTECSLSGRGHGHVSNFYTVDVENFATASRRYTGDIHNSIRSRFVYDTYRTMEATRSRHGWVHMFVTHRPSVTLQLHNFDLLRTCRTGSFCTVVWQLARFQLTRRIARSLGDSWVFCSSSWSIEHKLQWIEDFSTRGLLLCKCDGGCLFLNWRMHYGLFWSSQSNFDFMLCYNLLLCFI